MSRMYDPIFCVQGSKTSTSELFILCPCVSDDDVDKKTSGVVVRSTLV